MWYRENIDVSIAEDCACSQQIKIQKCDCEAIKKHNILVKQLEQHFNKVLDNE